MRHNHKEQPAPKWQPRWYLLKNGWFYCNINKNASTAIKEHKVDNKGREISSADKTFTVIRNPYDRLVSCFADRYKGWEWEDFLQYALNEPDESIDSHCRPQYLHLEPYPSLLIPFENINQEMMKIGIELNVHNKSTHKSWEYYYKPFELRAVRERYKQDFRIWESL